MLKWSSGVPYFDYDGGLTKREYFAGLAMQGMLSNRDYTETNSAQLARGSVVQADALIAALNTEAEEGKG